MKRSSSKGSTEISQLLTLDRSTQHGRLAHPNRTIQAARTTRAARATPLGRRLKLKSLLSLLMVVLMLANIVPYFGTSGILVFGDEISGNGSSGTEIIEGSGSGGTEITDDPVNEGLELFGDDIGGPANEGLEIYGDGIDDPANEGIEIDPLEIITGSSLLDLLSTAKLDSYVTVANESWIVMRKEPATGPTKYVMLIRRGANSTVAFGSNTTYENSTLQNRCRTYYETWNSPLKDLVLVPDLGGSTLTSVTSPTTTLASTTNQTKDIVFAISRQDAINWNGGKVTPLRPIIRANFPLTGAGSRYWTRTAGTGSNVWTVSPALDYISDSASVGNGATQAGFVPAVWIQVADVWRTVNIHYIDTLGNHIDPSYSTSHQVPYDGGITLEPADYLEIPGYYFTETWKLGSPDAAGSSLPASVSNIRKETDIYLVYYRTAPTNVTVTVNYIDKDTGNPIGTPTSKTYPDLPYGSTFTVPDPDVQVIPGYEYREWRIGALGATSTSYPITATNLIANTSIYLLYEKIEIIADVEKNAYLADDPLTPQNGTKANPVVVTLEDQITYTITTNNVKISGVGTIVFDLVPDGLELDESSIDYNGAYDPIAHVIMWDLSTEDEGEITVSFTVTVKQQPMRFTNMASTFFSDGTQGYSNATYHRSCAIGVIELFRELGNESNVLDETLDGNYVELNSGDLYILDFGIPPATITKDGIAYAYYGYRIDDGPIVTTPHNSLPAVLIPSVTTTMTVTYLYLWQSVKNAYLDDTGIPQNGTAINPIMVAFDDEITYTISTVNNKEVSTSDELYDVLFVLDWSDSMDGTMASGQSAKIYSRDVMLDMFNYVLSHYPGSRVAAMGMNSSAKLNHPEDTYIQYESDFLDADDYALEKPAMVAAFNELPRNGTEDPVSFFKAANQKMEGLAMPYGSSAVGGQKNTIPRKPDKEGRLAERIPVIVLISDFQIPSGQLSGSYWSSLMAAQSNRFDSTYPQGILITVRFDHHGNHIGGNADYATPPYNTLMRTYVSPAGRVGRWDFVIVDEVNSYNSTLGLIQNSFTNIAPSHVGGTIVTDELPVGLELVDGSISHGGAYNPGTNMITWDLTGEPPGKVTVEFTATVKAQPRLFENTAVVMFNEDTVVWTNTTYHRTPQIVVTEYFRELANESNILDETLDGTTTAVFYGDTFTPVAGIPPETILKDGLSYFFYGYRVDDGLIVVLPYDSLPDPLLTIATVSRKVTYLYLLGPQKNAYINGSTVAQNGTEDEYQPIRKDDLITYAITINNIFPGAEYAEFELVDLIPYGLSYVSNTDANGSFSVPGQDCFWFWDSLPPGETTVTVTVKVDEDQVDGAAYLNVAFLWTPEFAIYSNITYHELRSSSSFKFYKVDEADAPMEEVKFLLYSCTDADPSTHNHPTLVTNESSNCWGNPIAVLSEADGMVEFSDLPPGTYMLVEAQTQAGYQLPQGQWQITVSDTLSVGIEAHGPDPMTLPPAFKFDSDGQFLLLPNFLQMVIPIAGGPGLVSLTVLGFVLLGDGIIFAILTKGMGGRLKRVAQRKPLQRMLR